MTREEIAKMEQEMESLERDLKSIEQKCLTSPVAT
jgi:hypothetical protein